MVEGPAANVVEAFALEDGMRTLPEEAQAVPGGIWVDKTVSLNGSAV